MTEQILAKHTFEINGVTTHIFHASIGQGLQKHEHIYPHSTYVASGKIKVTKQDKEFIFNKFDAPVILRANEWHEIQALEDETVFVNVFVNGTT